MSVSTQKCMWCNCAATALCDAVLGMKAAVGPKRTVVYAPIDEQEVWTCDAPMCGEHARVMGFVCGKYPETIDHCPHCISNHQRTEPMLKEEADALRRTRHAQIRRSMLRVANS